MADESTPQTPAQPAVSAMAAQEAAAKVAAGNKKADDVRGSLLQQARAKMKEILAPAPAPEAAKEAAPPAPPAEKPAEAPPAAAPAPNAGELLFKNVQDQLQQALQAKLQAEQAAQQAQAEAARLKQLAQNPLEFLKEQQINIDQWQARLANGGAPTPEEQLQKEVSAKLSAFDQRLAQAEQDAARRYLSAQLPPMLVKDFPLVNARLGADGAIAAAQQASKQMGRQVDVKDFFTHLEKHFKAEFDTVKAVLEPKQEAKSAPKDNSPPTMTNKTTSSTGPVAKTPVLKTDARANGRNLLKQLAQAGRL